MTSFPTWSPRGTWFAYTANATKTLEVMTLEGQKRRLFASDQEFVLAPSWSPDGKRLAAVVLRGPPPTASLAVFDIEPARLVARYRVPGLPRIVQWSPDGRKVVLTGDTTVVVNTLTGALDTVATVPGCPFWAPGSDAVYYFGAEHSPCGEFTGFFVRRLAQPEATSLLDRQQLTGIGLAGEDVLGGPFSALAVSPSGTRLAIWRSTVPLAGRVAATVWVYDLVDPPPLALDKPAHVFRTDALIYALQWGPDESKLIGLMATATPAMELRMIDVRTGVWTTVAKLKHKPDLDIIYLSRASMSWTH